MGEPPLIDAMVTLPFKLRPPNEDPALARWLPSAAAIAALDLDGILTEMDEHGVEVALIGAGPVDFDVYRPGPYTVGTGVSDDFFRGACEEVARAVSAHPLRFRGFVYLDPSDCMSAVRRLETAVRDYNLSIAHIIPSVVGLPPNHPTYFPVYAKCVELGVPLRINVGMPGPAGRAELQRPLLLDEVLLTFPDLVLVGAHLGHPWLDEVPALLRKYPNFYVMTSGWAPSRVPGAIWELASRTWGSGRIMWASDHPLLPIGRCASEARGVPLEGEALRGYLADNARKVFGL